MLQTIKRLHVRNLPQSVDSYDLETLFSNVGNVIKAEVIEAEVGPARGYVEMATEEEAADCILRFNGQNLMGNILIVTEDKPHVPQPKKSASKRAQVAPRKRGTDPESKALAAKIRADIVSSRK